VLTNKGKYKIVLPLINYRHLFLKLVKQGIQRINSIVEKNNLRELLQFKK